MFSIRHNRNHRSGLLPVVLLFVCLLGCEPESHSSSVVCESNLDCPASQVCAAGACEATCLSGIICGGTDTLSGALQVSIEDDGLLAMQTLHATASIQESHAVSTHPVHPIPGSECVRVQAKALAPQKSMELGTIEVSIAENEMGASAQFPLSPKVEMDGVIYTAAMPINAPYPQPLVELRSTGNQVGAFQARAKVPSPFEELSGIDSLLGEDRLDISWKPGSASQVLLQAMGSPDPTTGEAYGIVCAARDEAGYISLPKGALKWLGTSISMTLIRRNLSTTEIEDSSIPMSAAYQYHWTVDRIPRLESAFLSEMEMTFMEMY